jgi:curved DNA-binding protein CbpA
MIFLEFQSMLRQKISRRLIVWSFILLYTILDWREQSLSLGRLAIKHHPDKNPDDPRAEERFKEIAIAYQTLSDDNLRRKYNEFGPKESAPEGGFVDPEEVFGAIFGGERFVSIIGDISLGREMKAALQEAEEAESEEGAKKLRDAKGREILSEAEKAQKEEKDRKKAAEVICFSSFVVWLLMRCWT